MNEFDIIHRYFKPLAAGKRAALELSDDAAILAVPHGKELIITKDAIVEGVHFTGEETPALIAQKLLRVNLSDLAAMGAKPYGYFLALMLPEKIDEAWLSSFAAGLRADQKRFGITLMGGDTTRTPGKLALSLTALGTVPRGKALKRCGAHAGDDIYVSGTAGDAVLGLQVANCRLQVGKKTDDYLLERYRLPSPRVELGQKLRGLATACMDISDGLMQDLGHIAECSGAAAVIVQENIPLSDAAKQALQQFANPYEMVASGGDDYELLFTAKPRNRSKIENLARTLKIKITPVGTMIKGTGVKLVDKNGKHVHLARLGYNHFSPL